MALLRINTNLTHGESDFHTQAAITHRGQAHFAGTGPAGMTCAKCTLHGHKGRCEAFKRLMQKAGPQVPADAAACKYFEPHGKPSTIYNGSW